MQISSWMQLDNFYDEHLMKFMLFLFSPHRTVHEDTNNNQGVLLNIF